MIRDHFFPRTIDEALHLLSEYTGKARIIAGGTDLIVEIRRRAFYFEFLVDIGKIDRLRSIQEEDEKIFIGAGVTFTDLETHELLRKNFSALSQAASLVGGPQIRNRGTLGGNIVSAQPAADGALALFALDATVEIASPEGVREVPIHKAYIDMGRSEVDPSREILVGVRLDKRKKREGSNYQRLAVRKAMQLPILACGVSLIAQDQSLDLARIAVGPVSDTPFRAIRAEDFLKGKPLTEEVWREAGRIVSEEVNPRYSRLRGDSGYRKALASILVRRALQQASIEIQDEKVSSRR